MLTFLFWLIWYAPALSVGSSYIDFIDIRRAVFFYLLGALLRRRELGSSKWLCFVVFLLSWFLLFAHSVFFESRYVAIFGDGLPLKLVKIALLHSLNTVLLPLACISCFEFFRRLNIPQSKVINTISSTTFAVYLIHSSMVLGGEFLWEKIFRCLEVQYQSPLYPVLMVATCAAIFAGCTLIDLGRQRLFAAVSRRLVRR